MYLDVGRVSDWHKTAATSSGAAAATTANAVPCASEDPGVVLTADLKKYFVAHGFSTEVMAASFRNADQVAALTACDHLTIGKRGKAGLPRCVEFSWNQHRRATENFNVKRTENCRGCSKAHQD